MGINTKDPRLNKSKWLRWEDMPAAITQHVVEAASIENYAPEGKPEENKLTIWLRGEEKGFGLNVTNTIVLEDAFGNDTDAWLGKVIELRIEQTMFEGKRVNCLRVHLPQAPPVAAPPPQPVISQQQAPAPPQSPAMQQEPPQEPEGFEMPPAPDEQAFD